MALDPAISDQLTLLTLTGAGNGAALTQAMDRNLVQGLGVVNTTLIQQHGSTVDFAKEAAAERTSIYVPQK